jgi:hypothetical protein
MRVMGELQTFPRPLQGERAGEGALMQSSDDDSESSFASNVRKHAIKRSALPPPHPDPLPLKGARESIFAVTKRLWMRRAAPAIFPRDDRARCRI